MDRQRINSVASIVPILMSAAALLLVLVAAATGWDNDLPDEGTAAHLFQLLVAGQLPIVLLFLVTSQGRPGRQVALLLAAQAAALGLAFGALVLLI